MPHQYQPLSVRTNLSKQIDNQKAMLSNSLGRGLLKNPDKIKRDMAKNQETLEKMTPPDLTPEQMDKAKGRLAQLREAYVDGKPGMVDPMPSEAIMQNPSTGSVGHFASHEKFWKRNTLDSAGNIVAAQRGKGLVWEAKDLLRTVNKEREEDDPDAASLENWRPRHTRVPLADSVVPQSFGLTPAARANYDATFPDHKPTPVEHKIEAAKFVCMGLKGNGDPCQAARLVDTNYCRHHQAQGVIPEVLPQQEPAAAQPQSA